MHLNYWIAPKAPSPIQPDQPDDRNKTPDVGGEVVLELPKEE